MLAKNMLLLEKYTNMSDGQAFVINFKAPDTVLRRCLNKKHSIDKIYIASNNLPGNGLITPFSSIFKSIPDIL